MDIPSLFPLGLHEASKVIGELIGYIGITVMVYGAVRGFFLFLLQVIRRESFHAHIRTDLGQHLALGLEFLVGKDIIESLVQPTWDELGKLGSIIVLRTILTLFLERELKHTAKEAEEERKRHTMRKKGAASIA